MTDAEQPQSQSYLDSARDLVSSAGATAQSAYEQAAQKASDVYQAAPAILPGSQSEKYSEDSGAVPNDGGDADAKSGESAASSGREERVEETRSKGPSDPARLNKSQQDIGTEYNVPTAAGQGTTRSADEKALEAAKNEKGAKQANVPQDYTDEPCPDSNNNGGEPKAGGRPRGNSEAVSDYGSYDDDGKPTRGIVGKAVASAKGNAKVIAGKIQKDEDKVETGKALKRGEI
ncbi:hypothetical protein IE81DRAFT_323972 [Ceraceosorus guamensis]|uniref:Uncharacterized protein n=1 Tax=Ceraceosorus guamensis TaxID=1522189 RepID=A0A316VWY7_9BASI|nr:hypothetical protein IE81DRAFT_323972 [Ceraceosorus guamensis]PWN41969.1 hypothetical protein IE81DRAFT_323972 [Ceraceosorus guamensis]